MTFHSRKLFAEAFAPQPFCFAVRRSELHSPEGREVNVLADRSSILCYIIVYHGTLQYVIVHYTMLYYSIVFYASRCRGRRIFAFVVLAHLWLSHLFLFCFWHSAWLQASMRALVT